MRHREFLLNTTRVGVRLALAQPGRLDGFKPYFEERLRAGAVAPTTEAQLHGRVRDPDGLVTTGYAARHASWLYRFAVS